MQILRKYFSVKKPCFENDCNKSKAQQFILVLLKKKH
jgi:hypothetical protein